MHQTRVPPPQIRGLPKDNVNRPFALVRRPVVGDGILLENLAMGRIQLPGNAILEVGYIGRWAKHIYVGTDLNDVPWMTTVGGQTFAQAYANLWTALTGKTL